MGRVSEREGYHLSGRDAWRPNKRQRTVLDALIENKTNAEIAAYYACPVTLPDGNDPPGEIACRHYGDGVMDERFCRRPYRRSV